MKIGFVVHFFDFRNDVRNVIAEANKQHEVVLFVRKEDADTIRQMVADTVIVRVVSERLSTLKNRVWDQVFRFFGKLPRSERNFYLMESFKICLDEKPKSRRRNIGLLDLAMKLPKTVSYDGYLNKISYSGETFIEDIEQFVFFTDISDSYFFSRILREKKPAKVYVYSWDHACKQVKFSRRATYLVWHEGIREDMVELQHIRPEQIRIVGASQFAYIHRFLSIARNNYLRPYPFEYLYFGCAIGIPSLARQEIALIAKLSHIMSQSGCPYRLLVRPYPILKDWSIYEELHGLDNVILDDGFRTSNLSVSDDSIFEKYIKIHFAKAFLHLGTTMGLEACFTDTPSCILDFPEFKNGNGTLSLANFVHQYQNDKYLMATDALNVIKSEDSFRKLLDNLDVEKDVLLQYNRSVVRDIPLRSFADFARDIVVT